MFVSYTQLTGFWYMLEKKTDYATEFYGRTSVIICFNFFKKFKDPWDTGGTSKVILFNFPSVSQER